MGLAGKMVNRCRNVLAHVILPVLEDVVEALLDRRLRLPGTTPYYPFEDKAESYIVPRVDLASMPKCALGLPIPPEDLWGQFGKQYGSSVAEYLDHGERHVKGMLRVLDNYGFGHERRSRILDFGCGAGRMIRWFKEAAEAGEVYGADIMPRHLRWCQQHLSPPFHFVQTTLLPHLPFRADFFDLIYACSVFTHIDDLASMWILELSRVLRPNGIMFLTIHDQASIKLLHTRYKNNRMAQAMESNPTYMNWVGMDYATFSIGRSIFSQVFYDRDYFSRLVGSSLEIVGFDEESHDFQTAVTLRKLT